MTPRSKKYFLFSVVALASFVLDQITKVWARAEIQPLGYAGKEIVPDFWTMRYSENSGVAFGLFRDLPGGRFILALVALLMLLVVLFYLRTSLSRQTALHVGLGFIFGGAVGNLVDRVMFGHVTDFIVWYYKDWDWPAFNIADAALCVGVGLLMIDIYRMGRQQPSASKSGA